MFSIPITLLFHSPDRITRKPASVEIDKIAFVKPFGIDNIPNYDVESYYHSDLVPHTAIHLADGRRLLVVEHPDYVIDYLDLYRSLDEDFTKPVEGPTTRTESPFRLISGGKCDLSEVLTPA